MAPAKPVVVRVELNQPMPSAYGSVAGLHPHVESLFTEIPPGATIVEFHSNVVLWTEFRKHPLVKDVSISNGSSAFGTIRVIA